RAPAPRRPREPLRGPRARVRRRGGGRGEGPRAARDRPALYEDAVEAVAATRARSGAEPGRGALPRSLANRRRRSEFETTKMLESPIATPASSGFRSPAAASGSADTL